jgi:hypothetical protein
MRRNRRFIRHLIVSRPNASLQWGTLRDITRYVFLLLYAVSDAARFMIHIEKKEGLFDVLCYNKSFVCSPALS